jgi:hypothetical protein
MTVKELIIELLEFDPQLTVIIEDHNEVNSLSMVESFVSIEG